MGDPLGLEDQCPHRCLDQLIADLCHDFPLQHIGSLVLLVMNMGGASQYSWREGMLDDREPPPPVSVPKSLNTTPSPPPPIWTALPSPGKSTSADMGYPPLNCISS